MFANKKLIKLSFDHNFKRTFWGWINSIFNKVDPSRIEEVGPDRAAAEWLIRCGAAVKWKNIGDWQTDYNKLPNDNYYQYKIEEIDGKNSTIMSVGFPHLKGLNHLRKIVIDNNGYLDNESLALLSYVKDNLEHLEILRCICISDVGVKSLKNLQNLKYLKLFDLPSVKNREECLQVLKENLLSCQIEWPKVKTKLF